jgi:hypothetical protein
MQAIDAVASRRGLSVLIVGLLAFVGSVTIGFFGGIAEPTVHDEFSYLLAPTHLPRPADESDPHRVDPF